MFERDESHLQPIGSADTIVMVTSYRWDGNGFLVVGISYADVLRGLMWSDWDWIG